TRVPAHHRARVLLPAPAAMATGMALELATEPEPGPAPAPALALAPALAPAQVPAATAGTVREPAADRGCRSPSGSMCPASPCRVSRRTIPRRLDPGRTCRRVRMAR